MCGVLKNYIIHWFKWAFYSLEANPSFKYSTRKPVGFMQSWNRTSHFKSHLLLIWNFQMRLEMRCAIWNFLKLFKPIMEGCLFETFRWDLKWDVLFETSETWNFSTYHRSYLFETFRWDLKWDMLFETFWNLKLLTHHKSCLFETFRWDLKQDVLFETF